MGRLHPVTDVVDGFDNSPPASLACTSTADQASAKFSSARSPDGDAAPENETRRRHEAY